MRCCLLIIFAFLLLLPGVAPTSAGAAYLDTLEIGLDAGYRQDRLNWRISDQLAGTGGDIVSELRYGHHVVVLAPPELRRRMAEEIDRMNGIYGLGRESR